MRRSIRLQDKTSFRRVVKTRPAMGAALSSDVRTFANTSHPFVHLPDEIFQQVLLYVDNPLDLTNITLTCKAFAWCIDDSFWKRLYFRQDFHTHPLPIAKSNIASRQRKCRKPCSRMLTYELDAETAKAWEKAPYIYSPSSMGDPLSLNLAALKGTSFSQSDVLDWQTQYTFAWLYNYERNCCTFCSLQYNVNSSTLTTYLHHGSLTSYSIIKCHCFGVVMCTTCILKQVIPETLVYRYYALERADIQDLPAHYFRMPHSRGKKGPRCSEPHYFRPHLIALQQQKYATKEELDLVLEEDANVWKDLLEHNKQRKILLRNVLWQFGFKSFPAFHTCVVRATGSAGGSAQFSALAKYYQHGDKSKNRESYLSFERAFTNLETPEAKALNYLWANDENPVPDQEVADRWLMYVLKEASGWQKRFDDLEKACAKRGLSTAVLDASCDKHLCSYIRGVPGYVSRSSDMVTYIVNRPVKASGVTGWPTQKSQRDIFERIMRDEEIMTTIVVNCGHQPSREQWKYWLDKICSISPAYSPRGEITPENATRVLADLHSFLRKIEAADGVYAPMLHTIVPQWYDLCPYRGETPGAEEAPKHL